MRFAEIKEFGGRFEKSSRGIAIIRVTRWCILAAIIAYLAWKLTEIGWLEIWTSLPTQPMFYVLFLLLYLLIPVTEVFIYRMTWIFNGWQSISAFIKKRIYNKDVLGYSGELYFFSWARQNLDLKDPQILETIRDNNIISSAASTIIAVLMVGVFLVVGELNFSDLFGDNLVWYSIGTAIALAILIPVVTKFRRYLFSMTLKTGLTIFGIQCLRVVVGQVFQIAQWTVVMPDVPITVWFTFAALGLIITRIPLIPNQNLIFMGLGVELSGLLDISTSAVAGMLLVANVLDKVLNISLFAAISFIEPKPGEPAAKQTKFADQRNEPEIEDA